MAIVAVSGGDHASDSPYPRQPAAQKVGAPAGAAHNPGQESQHNTGGFWQGPARLVVNDQNQVMLVQLIDSDGQVTEEIALEDLKSLDYHGVLVDLSR